MVSLSFIISLKMEWVFDCELDTCFFLEQMII